MLGKVDRMVDKRDARGKKRFGILYSSGEIVWMESYWLAWCAYWQGQHHRKNH